MKMPQIQIWTEVANFVLWKINIHIPQPAVMKEKEIRGKGSEWISKPFSRDVQFQSFFHNFQFHFLERSDNSSSQIFKEKLKKF